MGIFFDRDPMKLTKGVDDALDVERCIEQIEGRGRVAIQHAATLVSRYGGDLDTLARMGSNHPHEVAIYIELLRVRHEQSSD